jgi:hypothetical protein
VVADGRFVHRVGSSSLGNLNSDRSGLPWHSGDMLFRRGDIRIATLLGCSLGLLLDSPLAERGFDDEQ